jgi:hypothetical protein
MQELDRKREVNKYIFELLACFDEIVLWADTRKISLPANFEDHWHGIIRKEQFKLKLQKNKEKKQKKEMNRKMRALMKFKEMAKGSSSNLQSASSSSNIYRTLERIF